MKYTEAEKTRHFEHLGRLREVFSKRDRERLLREQAFSSYNSLKHFRAYSDWVKKGEGELKTVPWKFYEPEKGVTDDMRREKKEALQVLADMKAGKKTRAEIEPALKKVTMGYIEDWLRLGDRKMQTFTVSWVLWAPDGEFLDARYVLTDLASLLEALPREKWPAIPAESATDPIVLESLKYLRGDRKWGEDFDKAMKETEKRGRVCWLVACAIAKENCGPLLATMELMKNPESWWLLEMAPYYVQACGTADDIEPFEEVLTLWLKRAKEAKGSAVLEAKGAPLLIEMAPYVVGDLEGAMMALRLKVLFEKE